MKRTCGNCGVKYSGRDHRYCKPCFAAYMREWRRTHPMSAEQKEKARARSYANTYKRRGLIPVEACECGAPGEEMHHDDYSRPLDVRWFCRPCHLVYHEALRTQALLAAHPSLAARFARIASP